MSQINWIESEITFPIHNYLIILTICTHVTEWLRYGQHYATKTYCNSCDDINNGKYNNRNDIYFGHPKLKHHIWTNCLHIVILCLHWHWNSPVSLIRFMLDNSDAHLLPVPIFNVNAWYIGPFKALLHCANMLRVDNRERNMVKAFVIIPTSGGLRVCETIWRMKRSCVTEWCRIQWHYDNQFPSCPWM